MGRAGTLASLLSGSGETDERVKTIPSAVISKPTMGFQDIDPVVFQEKEDAKTEYMRELQDQVVANQRKKD